MALTALFMCSPAATWITGTTHSGCSISKFLTTFYLFLQGLGSLTCGVFFHIRTVQYCVVQTDDVVRNTGAATRLTIDGGSAHRVRGFVEMKAMVDAKSKKEKSVFKGKGGVVPKAKL